MTVQRLRSFRAHLVPLLSAAVRVIYSITPLAIALINVECCVWFDYCLLDIDCKLTFSYNFSLIKKTKILTNLLLVSFGLTKVRI